MYDPLSVGVDPVPRLYQSWLSNGSASAAALSKTVLKFATCGSFVEYSPTCPVMSPGAVDLSTMLITPAIASEPYCAAAPSRRISM